jgi:hypothetical protein
VEEITPAIQGTLRIYLYNVIEVAGPIVVLSTAKPSITGSLIGALRNSTMFFLAGKCTFKDHVGTASRFLDLLWPKGSNAEVAANRVEKGIGLDSWVSTPRSIPMLTEFLVKFWLSSGTKKILARFILNLYIEQGDDANTRDAVDPYARVERHRRENDKGID